MILLQILASAPSNVAVDNMVEKLVKSKVKVRLEQKPTCQDHEARRTHQENGRKILFTHQQQQQQQQQQQKCANKRSRKYKNLLMQGDIQRLHKTVEEGTSQGRGADNGTNILSFYRLSRLKFLPFICNWLRNYSYYDFVSLSSF